MNEDEEFDTWLRDVNEGIVESLGTVIDTEAKLLELKQNAAKEAVVVAHNRGSDEPDRAIRSVLAVQQQGEARTVEGSLRITARASHPAVSVRLVLPWPRTGRWLRLVAVVTSPLVLLTFLILAVRAPSSLSVSGIGFMAAGAVVCASSSLLLAVLRTCRIAREVGTMRTAVRASTSRDRWVETCAALLRLARSTECDSTVPVVEPARPAPPTAEEEHDAEKSEDLTGGNGSGSLLTTVQEDLQQRPRARTNKAARRRAQRGPMSRRP